MKRLISVLVIVLMLAAFTAGIHADDSIEVLINGKPVVSDTLPQIDNNRVLVPMRVIFEMLGAEVEWNDKEKSVTATRNQNGEETKIFFIIGSSEMIIEHGGNANTVELDAPAKIANKRTLVPIRAISEAFGGTADWNGQSRTVTVKTKENEEVEIVKTKDVCLEIMERLPENKNYIISPLSLKIAMAMAANGAEGETKKEILDTLGIEDIDKFNIYVKSLINSFGIRENGELRIADSIWFNEDYYGKEYKINFSDEFAKIIKDYYDGNAETVNVKNSVEAPNKWVESKTNGKIKNLIPEDKRNYLAALINAIYMKADWVYKFAKEDTYKETFTDHSGKETQKDFMHITKKFDYYENEKTQIVRLPYKNGTDMYVVLGDASDFAGDCKKMTTEKVRLSLPKFKTEFSIGFNDILKEMGIVKAFGDDNPEFAPMLINEPKPIKIDAVIQKAFIEVDETGTEAAAATAVIAVGATAVAVPDKIYEFKADKPFTYFILDRETDEIMFAGRFTE